MDSMGLHFIRPTWLLALPMAVIIPMLWHRIQKPSGDWSRVCDAHLLRWLGADHAARHRRKAGGVIAGLALAISVLSLAGPSWQKLPDTTYAASDAKVLVLDLSESMLAEDLKPSRLVQARYRLSDLLGEMDEGQLALVAYAGDAYVVSPLTRDMKTVTNLLPVLQPDIIPVAGSRADRALDLAAELIRRAGLSSGEVLLVSDSAVAADARKAAELADEGITTSVLAVGTASGAPIPSGKGFVKDSAGGVVIVRLETEALKRVATAGSGRYSELLHLTAGDSVWRAGGSAFSLRDDAVGARWQDQGPWLVLALLPLIAVGFRRGMVFFLPMLILPGMLMPHPVYAVGWEDLWKTRDQQALAALRAGDTETANALAKDPRIAAEALFREEDYEQAMQLWSDLGAPDDHYNRGNALAHAGKLEDALTAYDAALALEPDMEDAIHNRELVEKMLQQQQQDQQSQQDEQSAQDQQEQEGQEEQQDQEQQDGSDSDEEGSSDSEPEEANPQDEQPGEQADPSEEQEGERSEEQMAANWSEEDAQAMEQWLRRIPDDPSGLLRRKFRNQHQRRGKPGDEREAW